MTEIFMPLENSMRPGTGPGSRVSGFVPLHQRRLALRLGAFAGGAHLGEFAKSHMHTASPEKALFGLPGRAAEPAQRAGSQTEVNLRNSPNRRRRAVLTEHGAAVGKPPVEKIALVQAIFGNRMINDGAGFITQRLTGGDEAIAEFGVFIADEIVAAAAQVGAEVSIFFEHAAAESHVGAKGRLFQFAGFVAGIEQ